MNKLTNIFEARRPVRNVGQNYTSSNAASVRGVRRRPLICTWTVDPASGRLVCSLPIRLIPTATRASVGHGCPGP